MLFKILSRGFKETNSIKLYEMNGTQSVSGISATVFGCTGFMGNELTPYLGAIGSDIICPSKEKMWYSDRVKYLKLSGGTGFVFINHNTNFQDPRTIRRLVEKSNLVLNLIGPRKKCTNYEQFKEANIDLPRRIAKESRQAGVKRLIHFSSVGVDPRSESMDLATKFEGEKYVLDEFPDATIFRLCNVVGENDYLQKTFRIQSNFFARWIPIFSDLTAKRQPILVSDVGNCMVSALKMPETKGQIFELGGPHVYELKEFYDFMINALKRPTSYVPFNRDLMLQIANRISWQFFNREDIVKSSIDLIVQKKQGVKTIEDLYYQPVSVIPAIENLLYHYAEFPKPVKDEALL